MIKNNNKKIKTLTYIKRKILRAINKDNCDSITFFSNKSLEQKQAYEYLSTNINDWDKFPYEYEITNSKVTIFFT